MVYPRTSQSTLSTTPRARRTASPMDLIVGGIEVELGVDLTLQCVPLAVVVEGLPAALECVGCGTDDVHVGHRAGSDGSGHVLPDEILQFPAGLVDGPKFPYQPGEVGGDPC